jgi:hypothetical protein
MCLWCLATLLAVANLAGGCESFDVLSPQRSAVLLKKIQLGMSEAEVIDELGAPQKREVHGATDLLYYRTTWQLAEDAKWRNPIAIRDGKVVGFGRAFVENPDRSAAVAEFAGDAWLADVRPTEQ